MSTRCLACAAVVLAGLVLGACQGESAGGQGARSSNPPEVHTLAAITGDVESIAAAVGQIRAVESITLASEVAGLVRAIHFEEGALVEAGELLLELDDTRARAELASARAVHDRAARQLERFEQAARTAATNPTEVDAVRTDFAQAEAQYELARIRVDDHRIVAPFPGRMGLRLVSLGAYIQPGTALTTLTTVDPVDVEFTVPERFLGSLRPGLAVTAHSQAFEREFPATVRVVAPEVDPSTRMAMVLARAPNPDGLLRPGMFVNVRVVLGTRAGAVLVPEGALQFRGSQVSLYVVEDDEARLRRVRTGARRGPMVEIVEGVEAGEPVVIAGLQRIRDGMRVREVRDAGMPPLTGPSDEPGGTGGAPPDAARGGG
jgi:membrane fusion protein, multidrug efflux system